MDRWQKISVNRLVNIKNVGFELAVKSVSRLPLTIFESMLMPKKSKTSVEFICSECNKYSLTAVVKLANRLNGLAYKPICKECIGVASCNTDGHIKNNSDAQKISQNKKDTKSKNRKSQILRYEKNYDDFKYDRKFCSGNYKKYLKSVYNECFLCSNVKIKMDFHHIEHDGKGNKDSSLKNIARLCHGCHTKYHNFERYNNCVEPLMKKIMIEKSLYIFNNSVEYDEEEDY